MGRSILVLYVPSFDHFAWHNAGAACCFLVITRWNRRSPRFLSCDSLFLLSLPIFPLPFVAVMALGHLGASSPDAALAIIASDGIMPLRNLLADPEEDRTVRAAAAWAISQLGFHR